VTDSRPLRLGIVGTGFISGVHAGYALRSANIKLLAMASTRGRASRDRVGPLDEAVRLTTMDELLASDDLEAVMVCTRTVDHPEHAVAVLNAGKHLLLEKPGATTVEGQQKIREAAAAHPELVARVAYHRRHDARFRELARLIGEGAIGAPFAIQMESREDFPPSDDDIPAGGFILDVGVHDYDTARWLLGRDPDTVYAAAQNPVYRDADLDNAYITIGMADAIAVTHLARTNRVGMDIRCEVLGESGSIVFDRTPRGGDLTVLSRGGDVAFAADCREFFADAYAQQLEDFAVACRGDQTPNATLEDDRWAVAIGVAARASAVREERLAVGPSWDWH
jgi:predicted dehydrogenase